MSCNDGWLNYESWAWEKLTTFFYVRRTDDLPNTILKNLLFPNIPPPQSITSIGSKIGVYAINIEK